MNPELRPNEDLEKTVQENLQTVDISNIEEKQENFEKQNNVSKKDVFSFLDKKYLILGSIFIVLLFFVFFLSSIKNSPEVSLEEEEEIETVNMKEEALRYYRKINIFQNLGTEPYAYFYQNDQVTKDTMESKEKIAIAINDLIQNLDTTHPISFTKEEVEKVILEYFPETTYQTENVTINCMNFTFENNKYQGLPNTCSQRTDEKILSKIVNITEEENEIIIEEKVAFLFKNSEGTIDLYRQIKKEKINYVETLKSNSFDEFVFDSYESELYTYQTVFKKIENNQLLFEKTEKIANCRLEKTC